MTTLYFTDVNVDSATARARCSILHLGAYLCGAYHLRQIAPELANEQSELSATLRRIAAEQPAIAETLDRAAVVYLRSRQPELETALTALWDIAADRYRRNDRSTN